MHVKDNPPTDILIKLPLVAIYFRQYANQHTYIGIGDHRFQWTGCLDKKNSRLLSPLWSSTNLKVVEKEDILCQYFSEYYSDFTNRLKNIIDLDLLSQLAFNGVEKNCEPGNDLQKSSGKGSGNQSPEDETKCKLISLYHLFYQTWQRVQKYRLQRVVRLETELQPLLAQMAKRGVYFDYQNWLNYKEELAGELDVLQVKIAQQLDARGAKGAARDTAGEFLSQDSQLKGLLNQAGFQVTTLSKAQLENLGSLGVSINRHREIRRLISQYEYSFAQHLDQYGHLHPKFHQLGTKTGRITTSEPNIQGIEKASGLRNLFAAPKGKTIITADYDTCELRILAELSEDREMQAILRSGQDLHSMVATAVFGQKVSKEKNNHLRQQAKMVNFGLIYGMGPAGLSKKLNISIQEAGGILDAYFNRFPGVKKYLYLAAQKALQRGFCRSMSGRILFLNSKNENRNALERLARNMPVQGTSADITKLAVVLLKEAVDNGRLNILNILHDELMVECAAGEVEEIKTMVKDAMLEAGAGFLKNVPMKVTVRSGGSWGKQT